MEQWEYLHVYAAANSKGVMLVTIENGKQLYKNGLFGPNFNSCSTLSEYANQRGSEGWEMISTAPRANVGIRAMDVMFRRRKR